MLLMLSLVLVHKQRFNELINGRSQTNRDQKLNISFSQRHGQSQKISSQTKKYTKNITKALIFTTLDRSQLKKLRIVKIFIVLNLCIYLLIMHVDILKKKNWNKYSIFDDSGNENKGLLKKYAHVWDGIKNEIKALNGGKENYYGKDCTKIKFNLDDDLPLNKPPKFHALTIIIRIVLEEGGKLYLQVF